MERWRVGGKEEVFKATGRPFPRGSVAGVLLRSKSAFTEAEITSWFECTGEESGPGAHGLLTTQ